MAKLNFTTSPFSQQTDAETQKKFQKALKEIDPILRKHGFDSYMLSVHRDVKGRGLCSTAIGTQDLDEARLLLADGFRSVKELADTQTPNAPGGQA